MTKSASKHLMSPYFDQIFGPKSLGFETTIFEYRSFGFLKFYYNYDSDYNYNFLESVSA